MRIRGSAFYRDPDAALRRVFDRLEELGIHPLEPEEVTVAPVEDAAASKSLVEELQEMMGRPVIAPIAPAPVTEEGEPTDSAPKKMAKPRRRFGRQS